MGFVAFAFANAYRNFLVSRQRRIRRSESAGKWMKRKSDAHDPSKAMLSIVKLVRLRGWYACELMAWLNKTDGIGPIVAVGS